LTLVTQTRTFAQQTTNGQNALKTITTAVPFLLIAPDSRSGALGEAGVAIASDANAMHWNPSALAFLPNRMGFSLSYSPWLRQLVPDINLAYISGFYNIGERGGTVGSSLRYFSLGQIEFTDNEGIKTGEFNANEFALDVAYARKISDLFSAAVAIRYIYSNLASNAGVNFDIKPANSVAADMSFTYTKDFDIKSKSSGNSLPINFKLGINISNIGAKVSYTSSTGRKDFIPTNLRIGYAFTAKLDEYNSLTLTNDFNKLLVPSEGGTSEKSLLSGIFGSFSDAEGGFGEEMSEITTSIGLEYWYRKLFSARVGWFYEDPLKGNRQFITLGAGVRYNVFGLDFAYLAPLEQNHPLQNTLRFTLTYNFQASSDE